jgi:hypothetical protein
MPAWRVAERLAPLSPEEMQREIYVLDRWADVLALVIQYPPGISICLAKFFVRLTESRDVGNIIDIFASSTASGNANHTS